MKAFTSYERVKAALEHREEDRIPFDLGSAAVTGINKNALLSLRKYLGLTETVTIRDKITQIAHIGDDLIDRLKIDIKGVPPSSPIQKGLCEEPGIESGYDHLIDEWGMGWRMPITGGHYYDLFLSPLASAETIADVEKYPWPDALDPMRSISFFTMMVQLWRHFRY